jgi:hypothetical protein
MMGPFPGDVCGGGISVFLGASVPGDEGPGEETGSEGEEKL